MKAGALEHRLFRGSQFILLTRNFAQKFFEHFDKNPDSFYKASDLDKIILNKSIVNLNFFSFESIFSCSKILFFLTILHQSGHKYLLCLAFYPVSFLFYYAYKMKRYSDKRVKGIGYDTGVILSQDGEEIGKFLYQDS